MEIVFWIVLVLAALFFLGRLALAWLLPHRLRD
jgi:hypothetical protein